MPNETNGTPNDTAELVTELEALALALYNIRNDVVSRHTSPMLRRAAAAIARQEWRPIESAPKDGTKIRAYGTRHGSWGYSEDELVSIDAAWHGTERRWIDARDQAFIQRGFTPTHWMPLPTPPERTT